MSESKADLIARRDRLIVLRDSAENAILKINNGAQSYNVMQRGVSRADPDKLLKQIDYYEKRIQALNRKIDCKGSIKVSNGVL